jgi:hypothetical protein
MVICDPIDHANLTKRAGAVLERATLRRLRHEIDQIREICQANAKRVELVDASGIGDTILGFVLQLRPRTCVGDHTKKQIRVETVHALVGLGRYPNAAPRVGLISDAPLFLPAVGILTAIDGPQTEYRAATCLFRHFDRRQMDLSWMVCQLWSALTAVPAVLNAPGDAMNPEAADWFIERRDQLRLPLAPPLVVPGADRARPSRTQLVQRVE